MDVKDIKSQADLEQYLKITTTVKGCPIYLPVYRKLRNLIVGGYYKKGNKMLSEAELASMFDVGRTTLRTALAILYEDGYLQTFQGKGTFVVYEPDAQTRRYPDTFMLPKRRLEDLFDDVAISWADHRVNTPDEFMDEKLKANGQAVRVVNIIYGAGGVNAAVNSNIYCLEKHLRDVPVGDAAGAEQTILTLFDEQVASVNCTFSPVTNNVTVSKHLPKAQASNFLLVSSTWLDHDGEPIVYCKDYYNADALRFRMKFVK